MPRTGIRIVIAVGSILILEPADAGVFQFRDGSGVEHYTNVPSDSRYQRLRGWAESSPPAPAPPPPVLHPRLERFAGAILVAARRYGVDPRLVEAVVIAESAGNPRAVSRKGAQGLMQLMPARAAALGVRDSFDPQQNLDGGVRHLRDLLAHFKGDLRLALAAYNAGSEAVRTYGGVPPYPETRGYVRKILSLLGGTARPTSDAVPTTPQRIYRQVRDDGTVVFTNLPPAPKPARRPLRVIRRRL